MGAQLVGALRGRVSLWGYGVGGIAMRPAPLEVLSVQQVATSFWAGLKYAFSKKDGRLEDPLPGVGYSSVGLEPAPSSGSRRVHRFRFSRRCTVSSPIVSLRFTSVCGTSWVCGETRVGGEPRWCEVVGVRRVVREREGEGGG